MKNIIKYIKLILSIIVFSVSSIFTVFAEVEVEPSINLEELDLLYPAITFLHNIFNNFVY